MEHAEEKRYPVLFQVIEGRGRSQRTLTMVYAGDLTRTQMRGLIAGATYGTYVYQKVRYFVRHPPKWISADSSHKKVVPFMRPGLDGEYHSQLRFNSR